MTVTNLTTTSDVLLNTDFPDLKLYASGKVRDLYQVDGDHLLLVATDRISAFDYVKQHPEFDVLVTMDCDGQHEPSRIPVLLEAIHDADIVSGSRYYRDFRQNTPVPEERLRINRQITAEINDRCQRS